MTAGFAPIAGLSEIADRYDLILCDVFGTLHDARRMFPDALDALRRYRRGGGIVVLVSNTAEPGPRLRESLATRGIADAYDALVSAGDVARAYLREQAPKSVFHIGPEQDRVLFDGLDPQPSGPEAEVIVCTGYPDDDTDLDALLEGAARRGTPMLCTNPDTCIDFGGIVLRFAGLVAERHRVLGGTVIDTGKPAASIYTRAIETAFAATGQLFSPEQVIGLGDTLALDAAGALAQGFAAVLIESEDTASPVGVSQSRRFRLPALRW